MPESTRPTQFGRIHVPDEAWLARRPAGPILDPDLLLLTDLNKPFGMQLIGDRLYVGNTDSVVRYPYRPRNRNLNRPRDRPREGLRGQRLAPCGYPRG